MADKQGSRYIVAAAAALFACLWLAPAALANPVNDSDPYVSGTAIVGHVLTAHDGTWHDVTPPTTTTHVWQRSVDGVQWTDTGKSASTYSLEPSDIGKHLRILVTATSLFGQTTKASAQTGAIASDPPENHVRPEFSGPAEEGSKLTRTSLGTWSNPTPTSYSSYWLRCDAAGTPCQAIPGATTSTYTLTHDDVGHRIRVRVVAGHPYGSRYADSVPSQVVLALPAPAPKKARPRRLKPFPKIVIVGNLSAQGALFRQVVVRGPRNVTVQVRCRGRGCPYRKRSYRMRHSRLRIRSLERNFASGAVIEFRVVRRGRVGKYTRIRIRQGRIPARMDRCLNPGSSKPKRCSK